MAHFDGTPWLWLNYHAPWVLNLVPKFLRGLPWIRRGYWQAEDLEAARERAEKLYGALVWDSEGDSA